MDTFHGDLVLDNIVSSNQGNITLTSDKNILASDSSTGVVIGKDIILTSRRGHIGNELNPVHLDTKGDDSKVRVEALKDIYLVEDDGDLHIDKIVSYSGVVSISTPDGGVLDANIDEVRNTMEESERQALYRDMRLTGSYAEEGMNEAMENYRSQRDREYHDYWMVRGSGQEYDPNTEVRLSGFQKDQLKDQNDWTDQDVRDYENRLTEKYHTTHSQLFADLNEESDGQSEVILASGLGVSREEVYDESYRYSFSSDETKTFTEDSAWNMAELSNTVSAGQQFPIS